MNNLAAHRRTAPPGYTLVELLLVLALMSIMAGLLIPHLQPSAADQLDSAAQVIVSDIAYAQSLAISNSSNYTLAVDVRADRYTLAHTGANPALDVLPASPFHAPDDSPTMHTWRLSDFPNSGYAIILVGAQYDAGPRQTTAELIFEPTGGLAPPASMTSIGSVTIWLAAGEGKNRRYLPIDIDAITGIAEVGQLQSTTPTAS